MTKEKLLFVDRCKKCRETIRAEKGCIKYCSCNNIYFDWGWGEKKPSLFLNKFNPL